MFWHVWYSSWVSRVSVTNGDFFEVPTKLRTVHDNIIHDIKLRLSTVSSLGWTHSCPSFDKFLRKQKAIVICPYRTIGPVLVTVELSRTGHPTIVAIIGMKHPTHWVKNDMHKCLNRNKPWRCWGEFMLVLPRIRYQSLETWKGESPSSL